MSKRGSGVPLRDRARPPASFPGLDPTGHGRPPLVDACPARHCWVGDAVDADGVKRPGLLLEWRRGEAGWEGLVVYVARVRGQRWGLVQEWLASAQLTPR
ncbi:hypothetical protein [Nocardioides bruguierae]|uniref:Uncharacterized protein n=1 Tax=Nocardioides bruguierae TaxID=2945102 RepID=A0A9X2D5B5_9ACTN|nr:hypothetical protein [Nocardioides bruguierae]MCM0619588.1 hypothetical protein [Nocardioides bruguierae]